MQDPTWPETDLSDDPAFRRFDPPRPDNTWLWFGLALAVVLAALGVG